jgi:Domain of unknown function (DUF4386)
MALRRAVFVVAAFEARVESRAQAAVTTDAVTSERRRIDSLGYEGDLARERRCARAAGAWYLGLAVTGVVGFLVIRSAIYDPDDAAATLENLSTEQGLAHLGLGVELGIVLTQALAAVWFYKLFRSINQVAAWALGVFAIVNAVAVLASSAAVGTALEVTDDASLAPSDDTAATTQLLFQLSDSFLGVGAVFFGLWLIPMGWVAATSGRFPRSLGWTLVLGGVGYIASAFVQYGVQDAPTSLVDVLTIPATLGEFWMIAYLLVFGIRPSLREKLPAAPT